MYHFVLALVFIIKSVVQFCKLWFGKHLSEVRGVCLIVPFLSQQSDGDAIFWTNLHSLRSCKFQSFLVASWLLPS